MEPSKIPLFALVSRVNSSSSGLVADPVDIDSMDLRVPVPDRHLLRESLDPTILPPHGERPFRTKVAHRNMGRRRFYRDVCVYLFSHSDLWLQLCRLPHERDQDRNVERSRRFLPQHFEERACRWNPVGNQPHLRDPFAMGHHKSPESPDRAEICDECRLSMQHNRHHHRCLLPHAGFGAVSQDGRSLMVGLTHRITFTMGEFG